jgi:hypothetical protein
VQQSASASEDWQTQSMGCMPGGGTSTDYTHQAQSSSATSVYQETLAGTQTDFTLNQSQTDSLSSVHQMTSGGSYTMDDSSESLHTFSRHQEATAGPSGESMSLTSHVYDDGTWSRTVTSSSTTESGQVYHEEMASATVGSYTQDSLTTTTFNGGGVMTSAMHLAGTFAFGSAHSAPGGLGMGMSGALTHGAAEFGALAQEAAAVLAQAVGQSAGAIADVAAAYRLGLKDSQALLLSATTALVQSVQEDTFTHVLGALVVGGNIVGVEIPAKLIGVTPTTERLQRITDLSLLVLPGSPA